MVGDTISDSRAFILHRRIGGDDMKPDIDEVKDEIVNHPEHYCQGGVECIDAIRAALTPEEFRGYCKGNMIKYIWREKHKGGNNDIEKAKKYLEFLINK
jgi:hypothetical protein